MIVPPTEAIASLEAPNPRCTCIEEVTSAIPAQLLQYTLPFSISLIGIPLIITAIFSLPNPRILILESPYPPPPLVAYTDGVLLSNSGNSWFPNLVTISLDRMVETATGVLRSFAISIRAFPVMVTPVSSSASGSKVIFNVAFPLTIVKGTSLVWKLTKETTRVPFF